MILINDPVYQQDYQLNAKKKKKSMHTCFTLVPCPSIFTTICADLDKVTVVVSTVVWTVLSTRRAEAI